MTSNARNAPYDVRMKEEDIKIVSYIVPIFIVTCTHFVHVIYVMEHVQFNLLDSSIRPVYVYVLKNTLFNCKSIKL